MLWFYALPTLAITASSILVDATFSSRGAFRDRIHFQIVLWLVASLNRPNVLAGPVVMMAPLLSPSENLAINSTDVALWNIDVSDSNIEHEDGIMVAFSIWMNVIFLANIVHILLCHYKTTVVRSNTRRWWNDIVTNDTLRSVIIRTIAPSAWLASLWNVSNPGFSTRQTATATHTSVFVFAVIWIGSACIYWKKASKGQHSSSSESVDDPTRTTAAMCCFPAGRTEFHSNVEMTTQNKSTQLNESKWFEWTSQEVLQWISEDMTSNNNKKMANNRSIPEAGDAHQIIATLVVDTLASQYVTGQILHHLESVKLLRDMGVPLGPAILLSRNIKELVHKYPNPAMGENDFNSSEHPTSTTRQSLSMPQGQSSFLEEHDSLYNTSSSAAGDVSNAYERKNTLVDIDIEQQEQVQALMRDRFGLELPPIRSDGQDSAGMKPRQARPPTNNSASSMSSLNGGVAIPKLRPQDLRQIISQKPPNENSDLARETQNLFVASPANDLPRQSPPNQPLDLLSGDNDGDDSLPPAVSGILPEVLQQMPSHIQKIALRNPDLVRKLVDQRQQILSVTPQRPIPPSTRETIWEESDEENETGGGIDGENSGSDMFGRADETASLLKRRSSRVKNPTTLSAASRVDQLKTQYFAVANQSRPDNL